MKFLYPIIVVLATTMIVHLSMFSSMYEGLVDAQHGENQTDFIDIQGEQMNLTLGKPLYTEKLQYQNLRQLITIRV
jgi:hypothetical protein